MTIIDESNLPPESASKKQSEPKKRGRKGNKIHTALMNIQLIPEPANQFVERHGISINALRQHKRFFEQLDKTIQDEIGHIIVKQSKETKELMVWREV